MTERQPRREVWSVTGTQLLRDRKDNAHDGGFTGEVLERLTQLDGMWQGYSVLLWAETG